MANQGQPGVSLNYLKVSLFVAVVNQQLQSAACTVLLINS